MKTRIVTFATQDHNIRLKFPDFKTDKKAQIWQGTLQPNLNSTTYKVLIEFNDGWPKVFVESPNIDKQSPHRYPDNSLCLYYPADGTYKKSMLISRTILPWAAEWLYFYEAWKKDGIWWADEAPHFPVSEGFDNRKQRRKRGTK